MASTDAIPVPRKNTAFRFTFAIRKPSDSTLITTWAGADSEVSLDGAAFSDCTNEATEIGTTGVGYIDLTAAEMNADCVVLKVTVTNTGAVPLVFVLYPESAGDYRVADTQKVDIETIKTQTVTCAAGVTVLASVGTAATSTAQTGDTYALANGAAGFVAIDTVVDAILVDTGTTLDGLIQDIPTVAEFNARTLPSADYFDPAADTVATVTTLTNLPSIPANWLTAAGLAADAVTEIQSGLATAATLATVAGYLDTEIAAILADTNELQTDWANGGRLDLILDATATQASVDTIDNFLDTEIAAIQTAVVTTIPAQLTGLFGTVVSGTVDGTPTTFIITSDLGSVAKYSDVLIRFTSGVNANLVRPATGSGVAGQFSFGEPWPSAPSAGDTFNVLSDHVHQTSTIALEVSSTMSSRIAAGNDSWPTALAAIFTTAMTESYAADGVAPTPAQALFLIQQAITEFTISGTTTTIKKLDASTTAATLTLNDGTTPTAVTRAT